MKRFLRKLADRAVKAMNSDTAFILANAYLTLFWLAVVVALGLLVLQEPICITCLTCK